MENDLLAAVAVNPSAAGDLRRRVLAGNLHIEEFGLALRIVGKGVDLLVARFETVTAADLEPATRCR